MKLESSVTLFDDNKVEDRFAELQVTADGITAEVDALKAYTSYTHNATVGSVSFQVLTKVYGDGLKIVQLSSTSSVSLSTSGWANAVSNYPISLTTIAIATGKGEIMVRTSGGALQVNATDFSGYLLGTGVSY